MGKDDFAGPYVHGSFGPKMTFERSEPVEIRMADSGVLRGHPMTYRALARDRAEMFLPGSFVSGLEAAALNLAHDRGLVIAEQPAALTFTDSPERLSLRAQLRKDSAAHRLVQRGTLKGLSVEFRAIEESRNADGVRVISAAHLAGVGLVDSGSYKTDLELRARGGFRVRDSWFRSRIPYRRTMQCRCQGPTCSSVEFEAGAFDDLGDTGDVLAVGGGGFGNVLGSLKRGTLVIEKGKAGLDIGLTNAETETARRIIESGKVAPIYARPILDLETSEYADVGASASFPKHRFGRFL